MDKILYLDGHIFNYSLTSSILKLKNPLAHVIFPQVIEPSRFWKVAYEKVCFSPLTMDEARLCLKAFVKSVTMALEELHNNSLAHNDLRLPNICFNSRFEAVIIDIDMCASSGLDTNVSAESCLYQIPTECLKQFKEVDLPYGQKRNYMQLGWMIAYILDHKGKDEHMRTWEKEPAFVRENNCIFTLVRKFI